MWSLGKLFSQATSLEKNDRKELGTVGGNSTGDEKGQLSRFRVGSVGNEC
jgi:hypothetical protein